MSHIESKSAVIGLESIGATQTALASPPVAGAEKTIKVGAVTGVARKKLAVLVGDNALTEFKVEHKLNTKAVWVSIQTNTSSLPEEIVIQSEAGAGKACKITAPTAEEILIVFATAPTAGQIRWVTIIG